MSRNERYKPRNNDTDISRYRHAISKLHTFLKSELVTNLKFNYRREMQPLHDVNFDDDICIWGRVKNDVTLYHNVIFIILKVWKPYFQH